MHWDPVRKKKIHTETLTDGETDRNIKENSTTLEREGIGRGYCEYSDCNTSTSSVISHSFPLSYLFYLYIDLFFHCCIYHSVKSKCGISIVLQGIFVTIF